MSSKASFFLTWLFISNAFSSPTPQAQSQVKSIPLKRSPQPVHDASWLEAHRQYVGNKYSPPSSTSSSSTPSKRQVTATPAISLSVTGGAYYTQVQMGTPAQSYNVVLDTGSSDLWLTSSGSSGEELPGSGQNGDTGGGGDNGGGFDPFGDGQNNGQQTSQLYSPNGSSTFNSTGSQPFSIQYLGGSTSGSTARDTVSMGGITVQSQIFGVATQDSAATLPTETTGLIGMAWQAIATLGIPWWQSAASESAWAQPLFAVALARDDNPTSTADVSGGSFTLGTTDSSQFKGDIQYYNIPNGEASWWLLPLESITVNGQTFALNGALSAIDTGTTLMGGPQDAADAIYQSIPGAEPGTGQHQGYYFYPCSQTVNVSLSFGDGQQWAIDPADFTTQTQDPNTCMGSLFAAESGSGQQSGGGQQSVSPSWILGDTFLKNVYSVYRYDPPSVGFATLASSNSAGVAAKGSENVTVESIHPFTVTATGTARVPGFTGLPSGNAASPRMTMSSLAAMVGGCLVGVVTMMV